MRRVGLATPLPTLERGCVACCSRGVWTSFAASPLSGTVALRPGGNIGGCGELQGTGPCATLAAASAWAGGPALLSACRNGMSHIH